MSDLSTAVTGVVGPVFTTQQSTITTAQTEIATWAAESAPLCCVLVVTKLNSEPHVTNIMNKFANDATYVGGPTPSPANRLLVTYVIDDTGSPPGISESDHTTLLLMNTAEKENEVLKQVEDHYGNELRFLRLTYSHNNGTNKRLTVRIAKHESV